ncbi:MAG: ATPase, T2SS/T4P/T4SS family [bacterium]|nr:ATPase, T2SS/T4P/T4SS family [bacterium]
MQITGELLKKLLVDSKLVSLKDFSLAQEEAQSSSSPLEGILIEKGLISDEELGQIIADEIGAPFINLKKIKIKKEILEIMPEAAARTKGLIVFDKGKEGLKVALSDPSDLETREFIERKTGEKVIPYFATQKDIEASLRYYRKGLKEEVEALLGESIKDLEGKKEPADISKLPIIKITELILESAYHSRVSDVHFEPYQDKTILRYRIDGVLHDVLVLPKFFHDPLIARIKILSGLRTDLHDAAQDGRFSFALGPPAGGEKGDVRVSVVPVEQEEKAVLRLLSEKARRLDLKDLGLEGENFKAAQESIEKPWGMILVSGPTGSGKTTTLYAVLKILNTRKVNIMTIEDPIEYDIDGINQIQVNPKTNLTFAEGLKAVVRQNPDIIMVGEIRDETTASLAVNAAMTGHLVLSTFHANDASTSLPRLQDMGVEPFLITSTVNIIISQRLVRKICSKCIESYEVKASKISSLLGKELAERLLKTGKGNIRLFRGRGCPLCQETGYFGRTGIFEVLEMRDSIKKLVMEKANASQIKKAAQKAGMRTMVEDGLGKVEQGITTLDEILRATKE